jgi:hypothetical protein
VLADLAIDGRIIKKAGSGRRSQSIWDIPAQGILPCILRRCWRSLLGRGPRVHRGGGITGAPMTWVYVGTYIATVMVSSFDVVSWRPRGIGERTGRRGVLAWGMYSALAVLVGGALSLPGLWLFGMLYTWMFQGASGSNVLGTGMGVVMGGTLGVVMAGGISWAINESFDDPANAHRYRPSVRSRKKPRLPG